MLVKDFSFNLPEHLIARYPSSHRDKSRLLFFNEQGEIQHKIFSDFIQFINSGDLLILNNTRVIPARLFAFKSTGGKLEILIERVTENRFLAHVKNGKSLKPGTYVILEKNSIDLINSTDSKDTLKNDVKLKFVERDGQTDLFIFEFEKGSFPDILKWYGHIPLPPYMTRADQIEDKERYQTVYASADGAVAAPTAGLHFTEEMLKALQLKGVEVAFVTLHVGAGTFLPMKVERLEDHTMHSEWMSVSAAVCEKVERTKANGGKVIAVGTTSVRCLETAAKDGTLCPYEGETRLFIKPGFQFKVVDGLLTNFHLPESTLLVLVCAFAGKEPVLKGYKSAIDNGYRFYSYGDAMYLQRQK